MSKIGQLFAKYQRTLYNFEQTCFYKHGSLKTYGLINRLIWALKESKEAFWILPRHSRRVCDKLLFKSRASIIRVLQFYEVLWIHSCKPYSSLLDTRVYSIHNFSNTLFMSSKSDQSVIGYIWTNIPIRPREEDFLCSFRFFGNNWNNVTWRF